MTKTLTRSAVRIYGALSALGNGSTDILTKLLPFFEPILAGMNGQRLDPERLAEEVRKTWKWNFNADIVEAFLPRFEEAGWIVPGNAGSSKNFVVSVEEQETEGKASASEELRQIAARFQEFATNLSPLTAIPLQVEEYENILIEWLIYVEAYSEDNIQFSTSIQKDASGTMRQLVNVPNVTTLTSEEKFLCARFVRHELENQSSVSEALARIASIGLLTEVVQDFVRPVDAVKNTDLVVYLDAPIAMELLGVSGRAARENTLPVVEELKKIGAQVRIFSQSLDEVSAALSAVLQNPRPTGPTAQALARGEVLRDYVTSVSSDPSSFLDDLGVSVTHKSLEQTPSEHRHFTNEQRETVFSAQTFQQNMNAREHDADITTFAMRQRLGRTNKDLFESKFVVMTRNGLLAQVVRRSCIEMGLLNKAEIPPVVHRRVLAVSMWLRTGLGTEELEVPKRMLLAHCEQVLAIRRGVVDSVRQVTEALGDEEKKRQLDLLIKQDRSTQMLMDKTLGASGVVTEENISELFAEMLHPHLEEERQKGLQAVSEEKKRNQEQASRLRERLKGEKANASELSERIEESLNEDRTAVLALCDGVKQKLANRRQVRWGIAIVIAIIVCLPVLLSPSPVTMAISLIGNIVLAVLTITGGRLIGVKTSAEVAKGALLKEADERGLAPKLSRFSVSWSDNSFLIAPQSESEPVDLLGP